MPLITSCSDEPAELPYESTDTGMPGDVESFFQAEGDTLFASGGVPGNGWIIRSIDGGLSWDVLKSGFLNPVNSIFFTDSQTGYAADADVLIFKTTDGGSTWNQYYPNQWPLSVNRNLRDIFFVNDTLGFICGGKNFGNGLIYRTTDGGQTWTFTEFAHELRSISFTDQLNGYAFGYGVVLQTTDGGLTWNVNGGSGKYFTSSVTGNSSSLLRVTLDGSVEMQESSGWKSLRGAKSGIRNTERAFCIGLSSNGKISIAGHNGFLSCSSDAGKTWNDYSMFGGSTIHDMVVKDNGSITAAGENGIVYRMQIP